MHKKIVFITSFFVYTILYSQSFLPSNEMTFQTLTVSNSDVGDYDNDGDLDIIIMGRNSGMHYTLIYNNDGLGNFTLSPIALQDSYRNGEVQFIDYDNDNDLDIFISGLVQSGDYKSRLYQNIANIFTEVPFVFGGNIINNQFDWGDLDMDGDLDLLLTGASSAYLYRNDGNNSFTSLSHTFSSTNQGKILIGDLDNDGDNDIVAAGLGSNGLDIYKNNGNFNFSLELSLENFFNGDMELRDCDGNGLIDIIKNGNVGSSNSSRMYFNNGDFSFTENTSTDFTSVGDNSNFVSADYTGNGELDFLIIGRILPYTELNFSASIFENSGSLTFTENMNIGVVGNSFDDIEVGDFDNDKDIDLFALRSDMTSIYVNQSSIQNTAPNPPENLSSSVIDSNVVLNWGSSTDGESPQKQLTYNMYVGTAPGITNVVSPMSDLNTGYRKVVGIGNYQYKNQAALRDLPNGTYYWAVQSIDNQYEGSVFSTEQTFTIDNLGLEEFDAKISVQYYPNPVSDQLIISSNHSIEKVIISSTLGEKLNTILINELTDFKIDFTNYDSGIYFVSLHSSQGEEIIKIVKQ